VRLRSARRLASVLSGSKGRYVNGVALRLRWRVALS
jgi:hypothetical protein